MTVVITCIPSPYQVELFDAVARHQADFRVVYLTRRDRSRSWRDPHLQHEAIFLDEGADAYETFVGSMKTADLVVFADYSSALVRDAMRRREASGKPWCFWGERPGYRGLGPLGRMRRRVHLAPLHRNHRAAIWGIGHWAVEGYRREFGDRRPYYDLPYFSNLQRFRAAGALRSPDGPLRLLYSGALSKRKGVDLLATAFRRLAQTHDNVSLSVVGSGPLRPLMERLLGASVSRTVFHDFVPWGDLPRLYAEADVLCAPSRYDGWGLIVPEAMAAGMPVIGTDRMGAARELIEPGTNGWLVPADSERHLYEALNDAAALSPGRRRDMGLMAQSRALQQDVSAGVECFREAQEIALAAWHRASDSAPITVAAH